VLKEKQKEQRKTLQDQSAVFMSYEEWLRSLNLPEEAEKWRHRKNKRILLLEKPNSMSLNAINDPYEYTGLSGFSMAVTAQGVKFASKDKPKDVAFIDVGRVIKVYSEDDSSLLAALQLAQQKWGEVQLSGSEEYKRHCVHLAIEHNINISNPDLKAQIKAGRKRDEVAIKPEVGQRVTFHAHNSKATLTGKIVTIEETTGTVTLRAGSMDIQIFSAKGYFTETAPLEHSHTREHALERAKKHVGENGSVFFARGEGIYRGPIVETTPMFALQKTNKDTITLHRLKDLEGFDEKLVGNQDVVVRKTAGMGTVAIEPRQVEKEKGRGWAR
jgi:hypothetical protein